MSIILGVIISLGQMIIAIANQKNSIIWMLVGRSIFGIGAESIYNFQFILTLKWFYKSSSSLPISLIKVISRFCFVLTMIVSPRLISDDNKSSLALWVGFYVCIVSLICNIIMCVIDWTTNNESELNDSKNKSAVNLWESSATSFLEINGLTWTYLIIVFLTYGAVYPFININSAFLIEKFFLGMNIKEASILTGNYMSMTIVIALILSPLVAALIDKVGFRTMGLLLGYLLGVLCYSLFYLEDPLTAMILLGIYFSILMSLLSPMIAILVEEDLYGFAGGLCISIQNLACTLFPMLIAKLYYEYKSYTKLIYFFITLMALCVVLAIVLMYVNTFYDNVLNKTKFSERERDNSKRLNETVDNENELLINSTSKQINFENSNDNETDKIVNTFSTDGEERNFLIKKSV